MGFVSWWKGEPAPPKQKLKPGLLKNFLDMPFILKILTLQTFGFTYFQFEIFFSKESFYLNKALITPDLLWSSGLAWFFMSVCLAWPLTGYAMLRRLKNVKIYYLCVLGLFMLGLGFYTSEPWVSNVAGAVWMPGFIGLYLFIRKPVIEYFRKPA